MKELIVSGDQEVHCSVRDGRTPAEDARVDVVSPRWRWKVSAETAVRGPVVWLLDFAVADGEDLEEATCGYFV